MWRGLLLGLLGCPLTILAAPLQSEPNPDHELEKRDRWYMPPNPEDYGFKGIYWGLANNVTVCSLEKANILRQTVSNVQQYYAQEPIKISLRGHTAWERFMGGRAINGLHQPKINWFDSPGDPNYNKLPASVYADIMTSLEAAATFPLKGDPRGPNEKKPWLRKISFLCEGPAERVPGHCASGNIAAYTTEQDKVEGTIGWSITFCNRFFDIETTPYQTPRRTFLDRVVASGYKSDITRLETYEHILYHEYMHVKLMGHSMEISDIMSRLPSANGRAVSVYGASRASEFAHFHYKDANSVHVDVARNADNYAMLATDVWVQKMWNGKSPYAYLDKVDPQLPPIGKKKRQQDPDFPTQAEIDADVNANLYGDGFLILDGQVDNSTETAALSIWPRNCVWNADNSKISCTAPGMEYSEYLATLSTLTPDCQNIDTLTRLVGMNAVHPDCQCIQGHNNGVSLDDASCVGYVGYLVTCENDNGLCSCSNGVDPPKTFPPERGATCASLSRT